MASTGGDQTERRVHAVPPALVERARRLAAGQIVPATPRYASTVVLLRDSAGDAGSAHGASGAGSAHGASGATPGALEVYVLRRRTTMAFAPGMYAFPGGSVDARDADEEMAWAGPDPSEWADLLGFSDVLLARASVCAAVRETFEESGVVLAGPTATTVVADATGPDWERDRVALLGRELSFGALLRRRGLVLRSDLLAAWDHWVTPRVEERRFDTRFFVAALPPGQRTREIADEADRMTWIRPGEALSAVDRGEMGMLPPTYHTLVALSKAPNVKAALTMAAARRIRPIMPTVALDVTTGESDHRGATWALPDPGETDYDEGVLR
jgi:8-oxo-dGTP pyrophosphatase MutT (NUDIX family)